MVTMRGKMYWVMMYATPYILANLASLDFLNNNVQKVDGKTPFYDDETRNMSVRGRKGMMPSVRTRPTIHLKDSWVMRFTVRETDNKAVVYLTNTKKSNDGYTIANLLWDGTRPYSKDMPDVKIEVPVMYKSIAQYDIGNKGWKGLAAAFKDKSRRKVGSTVTQTLVKGHHTGGMTFYNRYTGHWNYNRPSRRGIRDELVTSFRQYILLCVENGVRSAIEEMTREGILKTTVTDIHVKVQS